MDSGEPADEPRAQAVKIVVTAVSAVVMSTLLSEPLGYLVRPTESLFIEAGWKSYANDRSDRIRFLLWYGADPNRVVKERRGYATIHQAAHWGSPSALQQLVDAGADANLATNEENRYLQPLDIACLYGGAKAVKVLVKAKAVRVESHPTIFDGKRNSSDCYD